VTLGTVTSAAGAVAHLPAVRPWTVLIVDDEPGLHDVTRLVLRRLRYNGRPVELISAYSASQAREILRTQRDIAVAVIDVVMEDDQAGLTLVRDIRDTFKLDMTRIILRTGNPGMAPERAVIEHFEIDDYRDKAELTSDRLFTSVYTALRAYRTLKALNQTAQGLEHIIRSTTFSHRPDDVDRFLDTTLAQIAELARSTDDLVLVQDSIAAAAGDEGPQIAVALGQYQPWSGRRLAEVAPPELVERIDRAFERTLFEIDDDGVLLTVPGPDGRSFVLWLPTSRPLEAHVVRLLTLFVERIMLNVENLRLQHEILQAQQAALTKLCEAVEMRSKETGQHIYRIAAYARTLGQLAGLAPDQVDLLAAAAPLHDIGKVAIADAILKKPGPLTADEYLEMKNHARYGSELLANATSAMLRAGEEIARTHHERWDGNGYPNGLAGEEIPLFGRIVSIVDVFDALMSRRVYKDPIPFEVTIDIMREGAGAAFDPRLATLFIDNAATFRAIFDSYPDPVAAASPDK